MKLNTMVTDWLFFRKLFSNKKERLTHNEAIESPWKQQQQQHCVLITHELKWLSEYLCGSEMDCVQNLWANDIGDGIGVADV